MGAGAGVHPLAPFCDPERCAAGVAMLVAATASRRTSRAVSPGESAAAVSRAPGQPTARGAELAAASPVAAHYSSVTREAAAPGRSQVPDWITHSGLSSCNPAYFGWRLLLRPKGELWCLCVNVSERDGEREPTRCGGRWSLGPTGQRSFLLSRFPAQPPRAGRRSQRGRLWQEPSHCLPHPHICSNRGKKKKSRTVLLSPAK